MQARLYHDLEFDKIVDHITSNCHSKAGQELAAELHPLSDLPFVRKRLMLISEIQEALKHGQDFDFSDLLPLDEVFEESGQQLVYD